MTRQTERKLAYCVFVCPTNTSTPPHTHTDTLTRSHENEFRHLFMYVVEVFAADYTSGGANDLDCLLHPSCDVNEDVHNTNTGS